MAVWVPLKRSLTESSLDGVCTCKSTAANFLNLHELAPASWQHGGSPAHLHQDEARACASGRQTWRILSANDGRGQSFVEMVWVAPASCGPNLAGDAEMIQYSQLHCSTTLSKQ